jgi:hypothetical protein
LGLAWLKFAMALLLFYQFLSKKVHTEAQIIEVGYFKKLHKFSVLPGRPNLSNLHKDNKITKFICVFIVLEVNNFVLIPNW